MEPGAQCTVHSLHTENLLVCLCVCAEASARRVSGRAGPGRAGPGRAGPGRTFWIT